MTDSDPLFPIFFPFESRLVFVLNGAFAGDRKGSVVSKHTHPFFECIFVLRGSLRYEMDRRVIQVGKGECLLIPPHLTHVRRVESDMRLSAFHLMIVKADLDGTPDLPVKILPPPEMEKVLAAIESEGRIQGPGWRTLSRSMTMGILIPILRKMFADRPGGKNRARTPHPLLVQAVQMMNDRIREDIGVGEIASACGISERHLSRLFQKGLKTSPQTYFFERKMPLAYSTLISDKTSTIRAVARNLGFHDPAYFSRVVREHFGVSPKEIREMDD
ncbi:MAG: helix-turn-helix transcriptional regulator [Spirochaetia bacterium]|nr:helix-turn-helix transcriptional regulator [Spirochaetia bacterium]